MLENVGDVVGGCWRRQPARDGGRGWRWRKSDGLCASLLIAPRSGLRPAAPRPLRVRPWLGRLDPVPRRNATSHAAPQRFRGPPIAWVNMASRKYAALMRQPGHWPRYGLLPWQHNCYEGSEFFARLTLHGRSDPTAGRIIGQEPHRGHAVLAPQWTPARHRCWLLLVDSEVSQIVFRMRVA